MEDNNRNDIVLERLEGKINDLAESQTKNFNSINRDLNDFKQAILERFARLEARSEYTEKEVAHIRDKRISSIETKQSDLESKAQKIEAIEKKSDETSESLRNWTTKLKTWGSVIGTIGAVVFVVTGAMAEKILGL